MCLFSCVCFCLFLITGQYVYITFRKSDAEKVKGFIFWECKHDVEPTSHCNIDSMPLPLIFGWNLNIFFNIKGSNCVVHLSWPPTAAHFVCLPHLTHLIQLISSLVETARLELGVSDEGDIQNVQRWEVSRTGLRSTGVVAFAVIQ